MAQDFVQIIAIGRLTADPELRYTNAGTAVATFTIACNRPKAMERDGVTADFHTIVVWAKQAELASQYLKKGSKVHVVARPLNRSYENNEGQRVRVTEYHVQPGGLQFLDTRNGDSTGGATTGGATGSTGAAASTPAAEKPAGGQGKGQGGSRQSGGQRSQQSGSRQNPAPASFADDPFADDNPQIDISDDDLPF